MHPGTSNAVAVHHVAVREVVRVDIALAGTEIHFQGSNGVAPKDQERRRDLRW